MYIDESHMLRSEVEDVSSEDWGVGCWGGVHGRVMIEGPGYASQGL